MLPISSHPAGAGDDPDATEARGEWQLPRDVELEELDGPNHPFVTEYLDAIETDGFDAAVIITPAIEFATMYRNAALAAELASRPTTIVDARTAAAGQALVVLAGAEVAAAGASIDEVVVAINDAAARVELVASLATIEPLLRSGPVPADVLQGAELIGSRSVFRMANGTVEPLGATETPEESLEIIRESFDKSTPLGVARAAVFHAEAPRLARRLELALGGVDFVSGFSIAMQVHTGLGVVGAAWLPNIQR